MINSGCRRNRSPGDAHRHRDHPAADGLGDKKSAGTVRGAGQAAQADFRQDQHEENAQGHPGHPCIPHDQGAVPGVPEESQAVPTALCVHPGQRQQRTNRPGAACHRAGPSEPGL